MPATTAAQGFPQRRSGGSSGGKFSTRSTATGCLGCLGAPSCSVGGTGGLGGSGPLTILNLSGVDDDPGVGEILPAHREGAVRLVTSLALGGCG
jgi:hypothetical protein